MGSGTSSIPFSRAGASRRLRSCGSRTRELVLAAISLRDALLGFYIAYLFYWKKPGIAAALAPPHQARLSLCSQISTGSMSCTRLLVTPHADGHSRLPRTYLRRASSTARGGQRARRPAASARWCAARKIRQYSVLCGGLAVGAAAVLAVMIFGRSLWGHSPVGAPVRGNDEFRSHHSDPHRFHSTGGRTAAGAAARSGKMMQCSALAVTLLTFC